MVDGEETKGRCWFGVGRVDFEKNWEKPAPYLQYSHGF